MSYMAAWRRGGDTTAELDAELAAGFADQETEDDLTSSRSLPKSLLCSRQPLTSAMSNNSEV